MGRHIRTLLIPSDGSPLHLIQIKTIALEPNAPSSELGHHPNLVKYWGFRGWERRTATPMTVDDSPIPALNGRYWLFRSLADAELELNKHVGEHCFGDAFVVKVVTDGMDEKGDAAYLDVPREILGTQIELNMVKQLADPTEM
ncbi:hypothetical protein P7C71_g2737, partial [Lecanoromycetidae sp. Uapishka_2]